MSKSTTLSISLPKETARGVERLRRRLGMTRSEFFRALLRRQLRGLDMAALSQAGGSFDFLKDEPDLYSVNDVKK